MINVQNVSKTFILHQQNGVRLPVLQRASLTVNAGECVVLHGHSGSGKSTLLRSLYANYLPDEGQIQIKHGDEWVDLVTAPARKVVEIRKTTVGWGEPVSARHPAYFSTGSGDAAAARYRRSA